MWSLPIFLYLGSNPPCGLLQICTRQSRKCTLNETLLWGVSRLWLTQRLWDLRSRSQLTLESEDPILPLGPAHTLLLKRDLEEVCFSSMGLGGPHLENHN